MVSPARQTAQPRAAGHVPLPPSPHYSFRGGTSGLPLPLRKRPGSRAPCRRTLEGPRAPARCLPWWPDTRRWKGQPVSCMEARESWALKGDQRRKAEHGSRVCKGPDIQGAVQGLTQRPAPGLPSLSPQGAPLVLHRWTQTCQPGQQRKEMGPPRGPQAGVAGMRMSRGHGEEPRSGSQGQDVRQGSQHSHNLIGN